MEQFLCFTLRQDVPDFNNITKVEEGTETQKETLSHISVSTYNVNVTV